MNEVMKLNLVELNYRKKMVWNYYVCPCTFSMLILV